MKPLIPGLTPEQQIIHDKLSRKNQAYFVNNLSVGLSGQSVEAKDLREKARDAAQRLAVVGAVSAPMAMAVLSTGLFDIVPTVIPALAAGPALVAVGATAAALVATATAQASDALVHLRHSTKAALDALRRDPRASLESGPTL